METSNEVAAVEHPGNAPLPAEVELAALHNRIIELESLASIGQLTAGILHEIKNPLNLMKRVYQARTSRGPCRSN